MITEAPEYKGAKKVRKLLIFVCDKVDEAATVATRSFYLLKDLTCLINSS